QYTTVSNAFTFAPALLTSASRPIGNTPYRQAYNTSGQVSSQTDALSNAFAFSYLGHTTTISDPTAQNRRHLHTSGGEFLTFIDETSRSIDIGYNTNGQRNSVFDRLNQLTTFGHHAPSGQPSSVTNDDGTVTAVTFTNRSANGLTFY